MRRTQEYWIEFVSTEPVIEPPSRVTAWLFDVIDSFKGAVVVVLLIFTLMFRAVGVQGDSMVPTLEDGNWVAVTGMLLSHVERGDIVVVTQPWDRNVPIIKRVIGVTGDKIMIDFEYGKVFVNGAMLEEPYIAAPTHLQYDVAFPVVVPEGKIFVMGDNRNISLDSRSSEIGFIDESYVLGKALGRIYPASQWDIYDY